MVALPGFQVAAQAAPVCLSQRRRHDRLREFAADYLLGPVAESALEGAIHVGHPAVLVHADDRVESSFEDGALPGLAHGEHGRPRLGDLSFPVRLASQFRLGNTLQPGELNAEHGGGVLECRQVSLGRGASGINEGDDAQDVGLRHGRHQPGIPAVDRATRGSQQADGLLPLSSLPVHQAVIVRHLASGHPGNACTSTMSTGKLVS